MLREEKRKYRLCRTSDLEAPNHYVQMLHGEYANWAFDQEEAETFKGRWRSEVFGINDEDPVDLEIGTGNGFYFSYYTQEHPERNLVGLEIKYKPLIQSIRRARKAGSENGRMVRYHASDLERLFEEKELNNVFLQFPDPWPKKRHAKNRLLQMGFLKKLHRLQRDGSFFEFKTDNEAYFEQGLSLIDGSPYELELISRDLHNEEWADKNYLTHFEKLWTSKGLKTHYIKLRK
jgi:tRNA (guanine-N7-)-methyltransferase